MGNCHQAITRLVKNGPATKLGELADSVVKRKASYVFFNNSKMTEDALKLFRVLRDREA
jgi:uncharacterized protein YecE (DUF72 family)